MTQIPSLNYFFLYIVLEVQFTNEIMLEYKLFKIVNTNLWQDQGTCLYLLANVNGSLCVAYHKPEVLT
jgi:hypothetical protein